VITPLASPEAVRAGAKDTLSSTPGSCLRREKGLRSFSLKVHIREQHFKGMQLLNGCAQVCQKVQEKKSTTYNEVMCDVHELRALSVRRL
jgi:hypothetical protein